MQNLHGRAVPYLPLPGGILPPENIQIPYPMGYPLVPLQPPQAFSSTPPLGYPQIYYSPFLVPPNPSATLPVTHEQKKDDVIKHEKSKGSHRHNKEEKADNDEGWVVSFIPTEADYEKAKHRDNDEEGETTSDGWVVSSKKRLKYCNFESHGYCR